MIKRILFLGVITVMAAGCYPGGPDFTDELDLVLTTYDESYVFPNSNTYAIPDQIPKITGNLAEGETPEFLDPATTKIFLDQVNANMTKLGYTKVTINADVVVTVAALEVTTIVSYCNDWWYGGWWGYYPGYPGYGGCYYPSAYSYSTGTLLISMIDDKDEDGDPETPVKGVWGAGINGLLESSTSSNNSRAVEAIDKAFAQSPYLKTN